MKHILICILMALTILSQAGCARFKKKMYSQFAVPAMASDEAMKKLEAEYTDQEKVVNDVMALTGADANATDVLRKAKRNAVLNDLIRLSDYKYENFKTRVYLGNNVLNTGFDMTSLGLSSAATIFGGPAGQALSATDTGLKGVQSKITERWLLNQTIMVLITTMDANRADVRKVIFTKMGTKYSEFSIEEGLLLIEDYHKKASLIDAVGRIQAKMGNEKDVQEKAAAAAAEKVK